MSSNQPPFKLSTGGPDQPSTAPPDYLCELGKHLSLAQLCLQRAVQLKRHLLQHNNVPIVDTPPADDDDDDEETWKWYLLNQVVMLDSLKAAVMDREYWQDDLPRIQELLPIVLHNT